MFILLRSVPSLISYDVICVYDDSLLTLLAVKKKMNKQCNLREYCEIYMKSCVLRL